ncbi:peptidase S8/S53 domain-containing protein [Apiosordaria backusii]|uniref:Peptidase S8/S53 domain-containing protein n=1 Tax=Apiosordaria backusii TaxID=314023 RepID=A0AA40ENF9_9PEZI|nr:peptidase S8/S53 domain-containing protein [Apiosordaria backusii]
MAQFKFQLAFCWLLGAVSLSTIRVSATPIGGAARSEAVIPGSSIAVKINKLATPSLATRSLVDGLKTVEDLVRKAREDSQLSKRNVEYSVLPLITTVSQDRVAQLVERATVLNPNYVPTDFSAWYQVLFAGSKSEHDHELSDILAKLSGYHEVTSCHLLSGASLPAVDPSNDPLFPGQGYMTPAGEGINAPYAWGFPGGDGANTTIIDIERGWKLDHEDLVDANITLLAGLNVKDRYQSNYRHGTAVLGEMLMVDNNIGGVGIIPGAQGHVIGVTRVVGGGPFENYPEAILDAINALSFGDAMLLEIQVPDANGNMFPVEIIDAVYDAIHLATSLGIAVIEPAGNGQQDLDAPILRIGSAVPASILNPSSPEFRDSGAIMVGAATSSIPRGRVLGSNYGGRIDVHSWGENILTTSVTGSGDDIDTYLPFDGTSGAAPIIAGAALSIQGMVSLNRGTKLDAFALRNLIKIGGTATSNPSVDKIGVQPNLRALIDGGHLFYIQQHSSMSAEIITPVGFIVQTFSSLTCHIDRLFFIQATHISNTRVKMKPQAILAALAGSYELLNITRTRANDSVEIPTGQSPYAFTGLLIYTSTGYMSAHMTSFNISDLPDNGANLVWPPRNTTDLDDAWAVVAKTTLAYAGALSVDPSVPSTRESGAILHGPLRVTNTPAWVGGTQRRHYRVVKQKGQDGGTFLRLSAPVNSDATIHGTLWWRKLD